MKGYSLHIGLNKVSSNYGNISPLLGCHNDAKSMKLIAENLGYQTRILLDESATYQSIINNIKAISNLMKSGDICLITYSGHGSQVIDENGDETDGLDETWVLYDHMILDDELHQLWALFPLNSRLVILSDSCHSGTIVRGINKAEPLIDHLNIKASGILISGCRDNQYSYDGRINGLFTEKLLKVWNNGNFKGSYKTFRDSIAKLLPKKQNPNYLPFGTKNLKFSRQKPFTI